MASCQHLKATCGALAPGGSERGKQASQRDIRVRLSGRATPLGGRAALSTGSDRGPPGAEQRGPGARPRGRSRAEDPEQAASCAGSPKTVMSGRGCRSSAAVRPGRGAGCASAGDRVLPRPRRAAERCGQVTLTGQPAVLADTHGHHFCRHREGPDLQSTGSAAFTRGQCGQCVPPSTAFLYGTSGCPDGVSAGHPSPWALPLPGLLSPHRLLGLWSSSLVLGAVGVSDRFG